MLPHLVLFLFYQNIPHKPTCAATIAHFLSEDSICHNNTSCLYISFEMILKHSVPLILSMSIISSMWAGQKLFIC